MRVFHVANPTIYYTVFYETLDALLVVLPPMDHPFDTSDKLETLAAVFFFSRACEGARPVRQHRGGHRWYRSQN